MRKRKSGNLDFSVSLGAEYTGLWTGSSTFVVTLVDASGNGWGAEGGTATVVGDINSENQKSRWCKTSGAIQGDVGSTAAPSISLYSAQLWDISDPGWSRYDSLLVAFDRATDYGGRDGGKDYVDTVFAFSQLATQALQDPFSKVS